ncbi:hypothetical protein [uncultured Mucilaginibacter sp.]|uniref:hypothetical protein n=1 Tax=uncultured Mucilaginibacter sp. TaxID=797541 RepID=UPI0025D8E66A|nr:hypothetical protein [uncultured Mucilaginibacter sp.]
MKNTVIGVLLCFSIESFIQAKSTDTIPKYKSVIYQKVVPKKIIKYIKTYLPGWYFPSTNLWDKKTFDDYQSNNSLAYFASGDFNGDQKADYVVLLTNKAKEFEVWVFLSMKGGWEKVQLSVGPRDKVNYVVGVLRPGLYNYKVSDRPKHDPITVKNDAVRIIFNSGSINVFYFDKGKFNSFMMEDLQQ